MPITFGTACLYCACFGFFHSEKKRSGFEWVKSSQRNQRMAFWGAWVLALLSLAAFIKATGWEYGIPIWLGVFTLVGVASLLVASLYQRHHKLSGAIFAILAVFSGTAAVIGAA